MLSQNAVSNKKHVYSIYKLFYKVTINIWGYDYTIIKRVQL